MNLLKEKIIKEIINQLNSIKNIYNGEIDIIINDLDNNNYNSLINFVNKYYNDTEISNEMKQFVSSLVEKEIIPVSYLTKINKPNTNNKEQKNAILRKKIIESRKIYLEDAKSFINNLEKKQEEEIYDILLNFYDIGLMQHCIKNLSEETLRKLFNYVEIKLKDNPRSAMDIFLEGSIKSHLKNI